MSTIGGPGGIGGPKGPSGPGGADGPDGPDGLDDVGDARDVGGAGPTTGPSATAATGGPADVDALAAQVKAGTITPRQAVDQLVDSMATPELGPAERQELRDMLTDLVANDPYLSALVGRV